MSTCKWGGGHLKLNHFMSGDLFVQEYIFKTFCISHFLLKSIDSWKWEILIIMKLFECRAIKCNLSYGRLRVKMLTHFLRFFTFSIQYIRDSNNNQLIDIWRKSVKWSIAVRNEDIRGLKVENWNHADTRIFFDIHRC